MSTQLKITAGDKGYPLDFTLKNNDGTAYDLTGASLTFLVQLATDPAIKFSKPMVATGSPTAGTCRYSVDTGDFDLPGAYNAQIQVVTPAGVKVTWNDIGIFAAEALPLSV